MSINDIRFRAEGAFMVLQVNVSERDDYFSHGRTTSKWRDATVEDMLDVAACLKGKYDTVEIRHITPYTEGLNGDFPRQG